MADTKYKVGDKVRLLVDTPNGEVLEGKVKVVNDAKDEPGKQIGVELNQSVQYGHSLDGKTTELEDPNGGPTVGKGWWTRPEYLEKA